MAGWILAVFAISDLHLPAREKPMDIFGAHWENHFERIRADWLARVHSEDLVLLPGDLTWAMRLEDAMEDLARIDALPGKKLLIKGNHDYWWNSIGRVRRLLGPGTFALQNDSLLIDGRLYAGTRGWTIPDGQEADADEVRIYNRERMRLDMSLRNARSRDDRVDALSAAHRGTGGLFRYSGTIWGSRLCVWASSRRSALWRRARIAQWRAVSSGFL